MSAPIAALVLDIVMCNMVETHFITSLIKSDGSLIPFFQRPIFATLAAITIGLMVWPLAVWLYQTRHAGRSNRQIVLVPSAD